MKSYTTYYRHFRITLLFLVSLIAFGQELEDYNILLDDKQVTKLLEEQNVVIDNPESAANYTTSDSSAPVRSSRSARSRSSRSLITTSEVSNTSLDDMVSGLITGQELEDASQSSQNQVSARSARTASVTTTSDLYPEPEWLLKYDMNVTPTVDGLTLEAPIPYHESVQDASRLISTLESQQEASMELVTDGVTVQLISFATISQEGDYQSVFHAYIRRNQYFIKSLYGEEDHFQTVISRNIKAGDHIKMSKDRDHVYFYKNGTLLKTLNIKPEYKDQRYRAGITMIDYFSADYPGHNKMTKVKIDGFTHREPTFAMNPQWHINYDMKTTPTDQGLSIEATLPHHESVNEPSRLLSMATLKEEASIEFVTDGITIQSLGFPTKDNDGTYQSRFYTYIRRNHYFIGSYYGEEELVQYSLGNKVKAGDHIKMSKDRDYVYFYKNGLLLKQIAIQDQYKNETYYASIDIIDYFSSTYPFSIDTPGPSQLTELRIEGLNSFTQNIPKWHIDRDEDAYGNPYNYITQTIQPEGFIVDGSDCDDWDANSYTRIWYEDQDGDGKGDPSSSISACEKPIGYVSDNSDSCPTIAANTTNGCSPLPEVEVELTDQNYIYTQEPLEAVTSVNTSTQKVHNIQYFDGLGRPLQNNAINASPMGKDIVTPFVYDEFGRMTKDYLPYASSQNTGAFIDTQTAISGVESYYSNVYDESVAFSEKQLEASPLNRVLKQAAPGEAWKLGSGHEIEFKYQTNIASEVKKFDVSLTSEFIPSLSASGSYAAGQLYKTVTLDENHESGNAHTIEEFKDKEGRVVLKRTYDDTSTALDTYYVYDIYGNLTYVLPPKMKGSTANLAQLGYQYQYDYRNRLIEKQLPGKDREYLVYDKQDRLVATQDANLKKQGIWLFTKYDQFGRVIYTGKTAAGSRSSVQSAVNAKGKNDETTGSFVQNGITVPYTKDKGYPTSITELLSVNIYDTYPSDAPSVESSIEGQTIATNSTTPNTKGLATASYIKNENDSWTKNYTYYDLKSRPVRSYSKNHLGGHTIVDSKLDFRGKPEYTKTTHQRASSDTPRVSTVYFAYDHVERLVKQEQQDTGSDQKITIVENTYDELGKLETKKVGDNLQEVNYDYNIRGWLTGINDVNDLGNDLFTFKINYDTPETTLGNVVGLFNGNISGTKWKTANDNKLRSYVYEYDALNRINTALYEDGSTTPNSYNVRNITYDENGNIKTLNRWATQGVLMDQLAYSYDAGNKLLKVDDASDNTEGFKEKVKTSNEYTYDANGNMITDQNKGITSITYNHLNLPTEVVLENGKIEYLYDAAGMKLRKTVFENGKPEVVTDYLDGYQYVDEKLEFYPHAEGYVNMKSGTPQYVYNYTDHLGNVRVSYVNDNGTAKIVEESNYYPFGLKHKGYNDQSNSANQKYKYGYNGKELQDELGLNTVGLDYRQYNPDLGRFTNMDPLTDLAPTLTPYRYAFNNPILWSDPSGLFETRREARRYKRDNNIDGNIRNQGGTFEIEGTNSEGGTSYWTNGLESDGSIAVVEDSNNGFYANEPSVSTDDYSASFQGFEAGGRFNKTYFGSSTSISGFNAEVYNNWGQGIDKNAFDLGASFSGLKGDAKIRLGSVENNINASLNGSVLSANANLGIGVYTGEGKKYGVIGGGEAGAYALKGDVQFGLSILGVKVSGSTGGSLGAAHIGGSIGVYYDESADKHVIEGFEHIGLGVGEKISVKIEF